MTSLRVRDQVILVINLMISQNVSRINISIDNTDGPCEMIMQCGYLWSFTLILVKLSTIDLLYPNT